MMLQGRKKKKKKRKESLEEEEEINWLKQNWKILSILFVISFNINDSNFLHLSINCNISEMLKEHTILRMLANFIR